MPVVRIGHNRTEFMRQRYGDAQSSVALAHSAATEFTASYDTRLKELEPLAGRRPDGDCSTESQASDPATRTDFSSSEAW